MKHPTRYVPLPTSAAGPMLATLRQRLQKAERSHKQRGPARRAFIHATARHLAFEMTEANRAAKPAQAPAPDLFGGP